MLLPFLDRDPMRDPAKRPAVMTATFFGAILVVVLTIAGAQTPQTAQAAALSPTAKLGQKVFDSKNCTVCHKLNGKGGAVGPDLTHVAGRHDAAWMDKFLTDPQAVKPGIVMPKPEITAEERKNLIEFLQTLK